MIPHLSSPAVENFSLIFCMCGKLFGTRTISYGRYMQQLAQKRPDLTQGLSALQEPLFFHSFQISGKIV